MGVPLEVAHCVGVKLRPGRVTMYHRSLVAALGLCAVCLIPEASVAQQPGELVRQLNRSGPRFGVTWLGGSIVDTLKSRYDIDVAPVVTQFGWQYERQFASLESGPVALNE